MIGESNVDEVKHSHIHSKITLLYAVDVDDVCFVICAVGSSICKIHFLIRDEVARPRKFFPSRMYTMAVHWIYSVQ